MSSSSAKARVWRFNEYGGVDKLQLKEEDVSAPAPGHVRLRVEALSLNQADLLFLANHYIEPPQLPSRIGYEVAGVIDAVGEGVTAFKAGDRASSIPTFSIKEYGNFGELAVLPERGLMVTPTNLNKVEGASFTFSYFTNYYGLFEQANLKPFQTVLVTAASSTTGLAAIPMIRSAGAYVIATSRTASKRDTLLKAGANHVIATNEEDLVERVMALTGGKGVDIAYDCIAGNMSEKIIASLRVGGQWVVYGLMDPSPVPFPWMQMISKPSTLHILRVFDFPGNGDPKFPNNDVLLKRGLEYVSKGIESGVLPITVDKVFHGLDSLPDAMQQMAKAAGAGKIVVEL